MVNEVLMLLNIVVCLFGIIVCSKRLSKMSASTTKIIIRLQYTVLWGLFAASGMTSLFLSSLFPAGLPQLMLSSGMLAILVMGEPVWRNGPPDYANPKKVND